MSAIGTKWTCTSAPHMSAFGVKRIWRLHCEMSANDPKRTSRGLWSQQPGSGKERPIPERWLKDWET